MLFHKSIVDLVQIMKWKQAKTKDQEFMYATFKQIAMSTSDDDQQLSWNMEIISKGDFLKNSPTGCPVESQK